MSKFLTTTANSYHIEQIVTNARRELVLVSPYLRINELLLNRLANADNKGVNTTLIYGKSELAESEKNKLSKFNNLEIYFNLKLHAKCYMNEDEVIISSMNLYEYSERNNYEMGVFVDRNSDLEIFNQIHEEVEFIKSVSTLKKERNTSKGNDLVYLPKEVGTPLFFLPSLFRVLKKHFNTSQIYFNGNDSILAFNLLECIRIEISDSVDFYILSDDFYFYLKKYYQDRLNEDLTNIRFFFNYYQKRLCVYPERDFNPKEDPIGLNIAVNKYFDITTKTLDMLKVAYSKFC